MPSSNAQRDKSFGMLSICRSMSSNHKTLFGSSIQHKNTITMYLREGTVERDLNHDFYMADGLIAEIEMSPSQFAEAITSMNMGSGVPVTIRWLRGEGQINNCPFESKQDLFEREFRTTCEDVNSKATELLDEVTRIFQKKTALTKAEKEKALGLLGHLQRELSSSQPYIYKQFNEQMEKTVEEAKGEIEGFMQNRMYSIANQAIVENKDLLINEMVENDCPVGLETKSDNKDDD